LVLFLLFIALARIVDLYTDYLWFTEVAFESVFVKILLTRISLAAISGVLFFAFLALNIYISRWLAPKYVLVEPDQIGLRSFLRYFYDRYKMAADRYINIFLILGALFISFLAAIAATDQWDTVLRFLNQQPFRQVDPIFGRDISFYVFTLPFYKYVRSWLFTLLFLSLLVSIFIHLLDGAIQWRRGRQMFASHVKAHLSFLLGAILAVTAWNYQLRAYDLLYSARGAAFGASYTDVHAQLPALRILLVISVISAALFLANIRLRGWLLPVVSISLLIASSLIVGTIYPAIVQQYSVSPNEIAKESPYIRRDIQFTRMAYGLDKIKETDFPGATTLQLSDIEKNRATIDNIRLWDWRPLLRTYKQIQEIRLYYNFVDVDIDRYTVDGKYRQVVLSARELDSRQLPATARTWINQHLIYTHGYGLVMNEVAESAGEGLPNLLIKNIPPVSSVDVGVTQPAIYFGEVGDDYVFVKTTARELDFPKGDTNQYTTYKGTGGVPVKNAWRKMAFAWRFGSLKVLLSDSIKPESRVMYFRRISERVNKPAPFLTFDRDPYLVISDEGKLFWIQDAYTITSGYPYSQPFDERNNYIRNSVKTVVDAYNGKVTYYIIDDKDPVVLTYQKIFPKLFRPFEEMPADLQKHIRYPEDLFSIQARMYATYHMRDPQVFYNKEDQWSVPNEIFDQEQQPVEPYYIIMKLPGEQKEKFVLILPMTPVNKNNMIAWLAAESDLPDYGSFRVFKFPKDKLAFGPMQIEARIDQNPDISRQLTLWGQVGSRVIRGNLLVIPIENSVVYVEPLYLQAVGTELPELKRVVMSYADKVVMTETVDQALQAIFGGAAPPPVEEEGPPVERPGRSVAQLIQEASDHFARAQEAIRQGDFAAYGEEIRALGEILSQLAEMQ
jgi:uncharacterized membrane protein (UPF0182 family)